MSLQTSGLRSELVHHFNTATGYTGACTPRQREDAHYERGRKDGLGQALELVDTFLLSHDGYPGRMRPVEEIVASVEPIAKGAVALSAEPDHIRAVFVDGGDNIA